MSFKQFFVLSNEFQKLLEKHAILCGGLDDSYYLAKMFFANLCRQSFKNEDTRKEVGLWIMKGGTLKLRSILAKTSYNENNLKHFNAMCLMDSTSAYER